MILIFSFRFVASYHCTILFAFNQHRLIFIRFSNPMPRFVAFIYQCNVTFILIDERKCVRNLRKPPMPCGISLAQEHRHFHRQHSTSVVFVNTSMLFHFFCSLQFQKYGTPFCVNVMDSDFESAAPSTFVLFLLSILFFFP